MLLPMKAELPWTGTADKGLGVTAAVFAAFFPCLGMTSDAICSVWEMWNESILLYFG